MQSASSSRNLVAALAAVLFACSVSITPVIGAERTGDRPDPVPRVEEMDSAGTAAEVDRLLAEELFGEETDVAELTDDVNFLRRVSLDLIGELPTAEAITAFALDSSPDKRAQAVNR